MSPAASDQAVTRAPLDAVGAKVSPRSRALRRILRSSPILMSGVLLALIIVFSIARPNTFPTTYNARNILIDVATLIVMATGMTFVMVAGGFDLSIGSVLVFSGVLSAKSMEWM